MTDASPGIVRVATADLIAFLRSALTACGLPVEDADTVARAMAQADVEGADTHGLLRLPEYVQALQAGQIDPRAQITVELRGASVGLIDGSNGMGHLAAVRAAQTAVTLARETGLGWVGVRRSNHAGAGSVYASIPVESGMIGIYSTVSGLNFMAPWGAREPLLGTNPIAVAVPTEVGRPPVVVDMATSFSSFGAVKKRVALKQRLDEGWMLDRSTGESLTDPDRVQHGVLAPMGGHKGSALALVLGLLAGPLNGAAFGRDIQSLGEPARAGETNTGQFVAALDVSRFMPPDLFAATLERHLGDIRALEPVAGVQAVRVPGDGRARTRAEREANGIPVANAIMAQLMRVASDLGLAPPRSS